MVRCIMSEYRKYKGTFTKKLVWLAPIVTTIIGFVLALGTGFAQISSYYYWYAIILPGVLTLICAGVINQDAKKLKCRAILSLPSDLSKLWTSKILVCVWFYFLSCTVCFIGTNLLSCAGGRSISVSNSIEGSILIFVTFLWLIPLSLFLIDKVGMVITLLINIGLNIVGTQLSIEPSWIAFPYAITSRLMCSVIGSLPSGLPVPANSPLRSRSVIFPGVIISIVLFTIFLVVTSLLFRKREAK